MAAQAEFPMRGTMLEALLTSSVGAGRDVREVAPETLGTVQLLQGRAITLENMARLSVSKGKLVAALAQQLVRVGMGHYAVSLLDGVTPQVGRTVLPLTSSAAASRVVGAAKFTTTEMASGGAVTLGLRQLVQGTLITAENMDRMLVSKEQVLVALVRQLVMADMWQHVNSLVLGVVSTDGRAALPWKLIMEQYTHGEVPESWHTHTDGCLDKRGATRLEAAIRAKDDATAIAFLASEFGAFGCRRVRRNGGTALMLAVQQRREAVWRKMLELFGPAGCSAASVGDDRNTALTLACREGIADAAMKLLVTGAAACKAAQISATGNTALVWACHRKLTRVALRLLDFGGEAVAADHATRIGNTALIFACLHGLEGVAVKLLDLGPTACNAMQVNENGTTALVWACSKKRQQLIKVALRLLDFGAEGCKANQVTTTGNTALTLACRNGMSAVALRLVGMGRAACLPPHVDKHGHTALMWACRRQLARVALRLLDYGPDGCKTDHVTNSGNTALMRTVLAEAVAKDALRHLNNLVCRA